MTLRTEFDQKAAEHGWKDAREFLGYTELHSTTERALFNGKQIGLALWMAGYIDRAEEWFANPDMWRSVDMSDLVTEACKRIDADGGAS